MNKIIPKRRFRSYKYQWTNTKLTDFVTIYNGQTYAPSNVTMKGTLILRSSNVQNDKLYLEDRVYVDNSVINSDNVKIGDIIMVVRNGSRSLIGKHAKISYSMPNTVVGAFMCGIRSQEPNFVNALLSTEQFEKEIAKNLGATINQITGGMLSNMFFHVPSNLEQKQIGDFFQKLDQMIELQSNKIEKYEMLKESYLEKMLPEETKVNPELRFVDFSDPYKLNIIKEVLNVSTGSSNTQDQTDNGLYPFYIRSEEAVKSNKYLYDEEAVITIGDGKIGEVFHYVNGKYDLHQRCYRIYGFDKVHGKYFFNYFSKHFFDRVMRMSAKGTVDSVRMDMIADMPIRYPKLDEQKAIGNFFSKLDNIIELQNKKLDKLKNLKQAYLNEMFVN